jgi:hypothetical protein
MREHLGGVMDNLLAATKMEALDRARSEVAARRIELARRPIVCDAMRRGSRARPPNPARRKRSR